MTFAPAIQLVPSALWGENLRKHATASAWKRLRAELVATHGLRCSVCGAEQPDARKLAAHEEWRYDESTSIAGGAATARLVAVSLTCRPCHAVEHFGRIRMLDVRGEAPHALEDTIAHFCRVNGVDRAAFFAHEEEAKRAWFARNALEWIIDWGAYAPLVNRRG